jgi:vacuolar-type H+-ATPase catalytic subunit A/Vma1
MKKQYVMLKAILSWGTRAHRALTAGASLSKLKEMKSRTDISNLKFELNYEAYMENIDKEMDREFKALGVAV